MSKLKWFLYLSAVVLVGIPILIVFMSDVVFSSAFSHTVITTAIVMVILGKLITVFEKKNENKSFAGDVGAMIGLALVLVIRFVT